MFHVIIPARFASTRLPGKPLMEIAGKLMICRVVECAQNSAAKTVTVATDDNRIARAVQSFGGDVVMTSQNHICGADRINEAAEILNLGDNEIIVNVQGDEPGMPPALIEQVAELLLQTPAADMATLCAPLAPGELQQKSVVKVFTDVDGFAAQFSRAAKSPGKTAHRHLGIYSYRRGYLRRFARIGASESERREKLEQLRALDNGDKIACAIAAETPPAGVDTAADLARARREFGESSG